MKMFILGPLREKRERKRKNLYFRALQKARENTNKKTLSPYPARRYLPEKH